MEILLSAPKISHFHLYSLCLRSVFGAVPGSQLEQTKARRCLNTISSLQMEGVDSSFYMQMVQLENRLTGCHKPVWDHLTTPPLFPGNKVHIEENQDNDDKKRIWWIPQSQWTWTCLCSAVVKLATNWIYTTNFLKIFPVLSAVTTADVWQNTFKT